MSGLDPSVTVVAVAPTLTTVATLDVRRLGRVTLQAQNLDPTQTCTGFVLNKVASSMEAALSPVLPLTILAAGSLDADGNPTDSVSIDIDCGGLAIIEFRALMSGAGGDVQYTAREAGPK